MFKFFHQCLNKPCGCFRPKASLLSRHTASRGSLRPRLVADLVDPGDTQKHEEGEEPGHRDPKRHHQLHLHPAQAAVAHGLDKKS